jgi:hypothetical protein
VKDIHELNPKDVLNREFIPEYEKGIDYLYMQLVHLNVSIYILEKIINFNFELFSTPERNIFFQSVLHNFYEASLLTITRLATDTGSDIYSLIYFKNRVRENILPDYLSSFNKRLRKARFTASIKGILLRARILRNERIGHTLKDIALGNKEGTRLDFEELISLRDALNEVLDSLSFNVGHMMLPMDYDSTVQYPSGYHHQTDIDEILDGIAKNSIMLNLPENNPRAWGHWIKKLSEKELELVNNYRIKFRLSEVERN